jgi:hypothetical protein
MKASKALLALVFAASLLTGCSGSSSDPACEATTPGVTPATPLPSGDDC